MITQARSLHFIGIGGAGMSPLAEVLFRMGHRTSGSDRERSATTDRLRDLGIGVQIGHEPDLVRSADMVVFSSAVPKDNPEMVFALNNNIPIARRAEMLGELMREKLSIGVSGTHGKTTTTGLVSEIFMYAGKDPTVLVGGVLRKLGTNGRFGNGDVLIAEADEYDRSFLCMNPSVAIVTNIEADHLDCYRDYEDIRNSFVQYVRKLPSYGTLIACADDAGAGSLCGETDATTITYGIGENAQYRADDIRDHDDGVEFTVLKRGKTFGRVNLPLSGLHNVRNATAAIAVSLELGLDFQTIAEALMRFEGVSRRFEILAVERGITIVDDYAHHPSEVRATLEAARRKGYKKVVAVFQPHLYSRTRDFAPEFAAALKLADKAIVTGIYQSREQPIPGVTGNTIVEKAQEPPRSDCTYVENMYEVSRRLAPELAEGDAVLLMGAGDIWKIGSGLREEIGNG